MKKFIIILSLIITILLNVVSVEATTYTNISYFYITVSSEQYNDDTFCLNSGDYTIKIVDYYTDQVYNASFNKKADSSGVYYYSFKTPIYFKYDSTGVTNYDYDIYLINTEGEKEYFLSIDNATTYMYSFDSFSVYTEDSGTTESPGDSESPDGSGSGSDGSVVTLDVTLLHNDLLILIIIVSFFEFMKMINIIVRNLSGGGK